MACRPTPALSQTPDGPVLQGTFGTDPPGISCIKRDETRCAMTQSSFPPERRQALDRLQSNAAKHPAETAHSQDQATHLAPLSVGPDARGHAEARDGRRAMTLKWRGSPISDPARAGDEAWRVFVWLRHRTGVYARTLRSSDPLAAEQAAMADDEVLATLGSHLLGPWPGLRNGAEYESTESAGHLDRELSLGGCEYSRVTIGRGPRRPGEAVSDRRARMRLTGRVTARTATIGSDGGIESRGLP